MFVICFQIVAFVLLFSGGVCLSFYSAHQATFDRLCKKGLADRKRLRGRIRDLEGRKKTDPRKWGSVRPSGFDKNGNRVL